MNPSTTQSPDSLGSPSGSRSSDAVETHTCCRSREGITVGLIDGIIASARVIRQREAQSAHDGEYSEAVTQALEDLRQDDDMNWLMNFDAENGARNLREIIAGKDRELKLLSGAVKSISENTERGDG